MEETINTAYLSLGSNLGDRAHNLHEAIQCISKSIGAVVSISANYKTKSWGYSSSNDYYNCCIEIKTKLTPSELLFACQKIELELGRIKTPTYSDRTIDIDILFYNNDVIAQENLQIPHPLLTKRHFVLVPLNEIASNYMHPQHFLTISQYLHNLGEHEKATRV